MARPKGFSNFNALHAKNAQAMSDVSNSNYCLNDLPNEFPGEIPIVRSLFELKESEEPKKGERYFYHPFLQACCVPEH